MIEKAHLLLYSDTFLGSIARARTLNLRDTLGWTGSPLSTPARASPHIWRTHWMGRVMHLLWETSSTINDPQGILNRPTNRISDIPLSRVLPSRNLYWVGDIANRQGKRPIHPAT